MDTPEPRPEELQAMVADLHCQGCLNTWQPLEKTMENIASFREGKPFENTVSKLIQHLQKHGAVQTDSSGKIAAIRMNSAAATFMRPGILEKIRYEIENGISR